MVPRTLVLLFTILKTDAIFCRGHTWALRGHITTQKPGHSRASPIWWIWIPCPALV